MTISLSSASLRPIRAEKIQTGAWFSHDSTNVTCPLSSVAKLLFDLESRCAHARKSRSALLHWLGLKLDARRALSSFSLVHKKKRKNKNNNNPNYCNGEDEEIAVHRLVMSVHHDCCVCAKVKEKKRTWLGIFGFFITQYISLCLLEHLQHVQ